MNTATVEPIEVTGTLFNSLREKAKAMNRAPGITHCHVLNMVAHEAGFKDWAALRRRYDECQQKAGSSE